MIHQEGVASAESELESVIDHTQPIVYVQDKIRNFLTAFNETYKGVLLNCEQSDRANIELLLTTLKKDINSTLVEMNDLKRGEQSRAYNNVRNEEEEAGALSDSSSDSNMFLQGSSSDSEDQNETVAQQTSEASNEFNFPTPTEENVNTFRFQFAVKYDDQVAYNLFPEGIMQAIRKFDKLEYPSIMRISPVGATCFVCGCELKHMRVSKHNLLNHVMGQKHLGLATEKAVIEIVNNFHEFWLREELCYQIHLVHFRPADLSNVLCICCDLFLPWKQVRSHIISEIHQNRVIKLYKAKSNFSLIEAQMVKYGLLKEKEEVPRPEKKKNTARPKMPRDMRSQKMTNGAKSAIPKEITHNIIKSVEKPDSENPIDLLPNRMKCDAEYFTRVQTRKPTIIICKLCKCELPDKIGALKSHVATSAEHRSLKRDNYKYYCEICNETLSNEELWMKHDFKAKRHTNMASSRKNNVTEYECTECKMVIFGDILSITRHKAIGKPVQRERGARLSELVKKLLASKESIVKSGAAMAREAEEVLANNLVQDCCESISSALIESFPECKVYPFGSRVSGAGSMASDLDVFVDIGDCYNGQLHQDPADQVRILGKVNKLLLKRSEFSNINARRSARTPILTVHHTPTDLECDLSFKNGLSVENTKYLRFCMELQPLCQQLILITKKWAEYTTLCCTVTNYALATLCIFYMQVTNYLPSVEHLRKIDGTEVPIVGGWEVISYVQPIDKIREQFKPYDKTIHELLKEFFAYYSTFDFKKKVVCPLLGHTVQRTIFPDKEAGQPGNLPPAMHTYALQLERRDPEKFRIDSCMCIQDPFDLCHNLTKAAQPATMQRFQNMCKLTLKHLESIAE